MNKYNINIPTHKKLEMLNTLFEDHAAWLITNKAQKEHIDEYGKRIAIGEMYFHRVVGNGITDIAKLSIESLDTLIELIFSNNKMLILCSLKAIKTHEKALLKHF